MSDEFDERVIAHGSTPLRALVLSEVSSDLLCDPTVLSGLGHALDVLEIVIPPDCLDLDAAHDYFDRTVFVSLCATWPIADALDRDFRAKDHTTPLLLKVNLALANNRNLAADVSRARGHANGP